MTSRSGVPPLSHRARIESQMVRRREREYDNQELWTGRKNYYEKYEKQNAKYDEWTSPRYQEHHTRLLEKRKQEQEKQEKLEVRREKLRKLLREEHDLHQTELMVRKGTRSVNLPRTKPDVPTELLKSLNRSLKLEEDDRRRHEAEMKLYHHWRSTNPVLQHYERMHKARDLKLSWLDQQIEARMRKQRDEEENRRLLKQQERLVQEELAKEATVKQEIEAKREQLIRDLDEQMAALKEKTRISEGLRAQEDEELKRQSQIGEVEDMRREADKRRETLECALYNVKQHQLRLKKKVEIVEKTLEEEQCLIRKLRDLDVIERLEDVNRRQELKRSLDEFLKLAEEQKELERCRRRHMDFIFDSEAKYRYEQQDQIWRLEAKARADLLSEVLQTIRRQIDENVRKNRERQAQVVREREEMIEKIDKHRQEMDTLKEEQERRKVETKKRIDDEVELKRLRKKELESGELKQIDLELEQVRKEEERLKREIINIQKRQGPIRPQRSRIFS